MQDENYWQCFMLFQWRCHYFFLTLNLSKTLCDKTWQWCEINAMKSNFYNSFFTSLISGPVIGFRNLFFEWRLGQQLRKPRWTRGGRWPSVGRTRPRYFVEWGWCQHGLDIWITFHIFQSVVGMPIFFAFQAFEAVPGLSIFVLQLNILIKLVHFFNIENKVKNDSSSIEQILFTEQH